MTETRDFPTAVIASLSTGILICEFSQMHEAAEYLMGYPIWTRHFASEELWHKMQCAVVEQCPEMPTVIAGINKDNCLAKLADLEGKIGKTVKIKKGDGASAMHPFEGLSESKPIIVVRTDDQE